MQKKSKEEMLKWAESIPIEELYDELRHLTGLLDLKFTSMVALDRCDQPIIRFSSQDLVEKVGFLKLMFASIIIKEFNSSVKYNEDDDQFSFWGTACFNYTHLRGGSNGCTFLTFWYTDAGWKFDSYA